MIAHVDAPPLLDCLRRCGLDETSAPALVRAEDYCADRLRLARSTLAALRGASSPGMASFALGSLGRGEASEQSDLDLAFLFDSAVVDAGTAADLRSRAIDALRVAFEIPEKTFREPVDVRSLVRNVGGSLDTNDTLTYRALVMTEAAWLHNARAALAVKEVIFDSYARARISRGRFLGSLANDLHRYYRTLCVDYRFKVEEQDKGWAIRVLKLRHARKLWHLANLALHCATTRITDDARRDHHLAARLDWPPIVRLLTSLEAFEIGSAAAPLVPVYDSFFAELGRAEVREELSALAYEARERSSVYTGLRANAEAFDAASAEVVEALLEHCRDHLLRFFVL